MQTFLFTTAQIAGVGRGKVGDELRIQKTQRKQTSLKHLKKRVQATEYKHKGYETCMENTVDRQGGPRELSLTTRKGKH